MGHCPHLTKKTEAHKGKVRWAQKCAGTRSQPGSTDLRREQETVRRKQPTTPILPAAPPPPAPALFLGLPDNSRSRDRTPTYRPTSLQTAAPTLPGLAYPRSPSPSRVASAPGPPRPSYSFLGPASPFEFPAAPPSFPGSTNHGYLPPEVSACASPLFRPLGLASGSCKKKFPPE